MSASEDYLTFVKDQLRQMGEVTSKRMFGGAGLYCDGLFFAIVENDRLRFKVDDSNRADFEELGMEPFKPFDDKPGVMSYYEVPVDILEDQDALTEWAGKAVDVARRSKKKGRR